jgi:group II intron reverse transcriptase/maturase
MEKQIQFFDSTADSPQGDTAKADKGEPSSAGYVVPKGWEERKEAFPAITMEEIAKEENLKLAFKKVKANRGAPGHDGKTVEEVEEKLGEIVPRIRRELLMGAYHPGAIRRVWIPKPGGEQRGLGIPSVVDRMVQQAMLQIMSPHYEPYFHPSSHGFRPGKSCHTAIAEAKSHVEEGHDWVVDIDLEKYFDRVNHHRLLSRLQNKISDKRVMKLIQRLLEASVIMPDGVVLSTEEGVPQGGPLSCLMSNIVLDELDWELHTRGHRFVRYADDQNIYVRSERAGQRVMESVRQFIERRLKLKINATKSAVAKTEERHFLGFRLERDPLDGEVSVRLSKRSKRRIDGKVREKTPRNWGGSLNKCIGKLNEYLTGWVEFFKVCSERERTILESIDAHTRRRLRALILRQCKRKRFIARRLIRLGVKPKTAWNNVYRGRQSLWALSHNVAVERGLRNAYFAKRGLVSLAASWDRFNPKTNAVVPVQLSLDLG